VEFYGTKNLGFQAIYTRCFVPQHDIKRHFSNNLLGKVVFGKPYFILVEAKQDDFEGGWAQCLAEMIAAQRLDEELKVTIYGIVSNGGLWQFGKLEENIFTRNKKMYTIQELDELFAAVNYTFQKCELQLQN
jgi:hypothetical protein